MESATTAAAVDHHGLPSGNVAFLFTDIEGSTVRWDRDQAAMTQAVRRHDQLMREAIQAHKGHVFKTIGDAFCAVFWSIQDGVGATLDAQRALAKEDFSAVDGVRVRMALHVGTSDERDGDYFGPTLNRVARLLAIGHGAQVLVSGAAAEQLSAALPELSLRDMGEHRLKDLTAPEHVFQLLAADLPAEFPKLKSLSVLDNNLPLQLTSLVGRESDVTEIRALLTGSRLVTLIGSGGVGKTRCALQVGAEALDGFADGVWLVDLAPLSNPSLVPNVIAAVFEVQEQPNQPVLASLIAHLKNRQLLLVIDNCEHVIHEASKTIDEILRGCSKISVLATSREGLAIHGESIYRMPSLTVPDSPKDLLAEQALTYGSIALFDARARAANPKFTISNETASAVADICRRLDGIPLAIELAAARVKVLSVPTLAQRLDERFKILTGGSRTALPRQQTMRALIDWSYDLLSEREQTIFRSFSIFASAFTLDHASSVCSSDEIEDFEVLDLLTSLVDKSLLQADHSGAEVRYRMLESTRQYAHEKLVERGEYEAVVRRHAQTYLALSEELDRAWDETPDREWMARAEPEVANWRAAISWAFGQNGDAALGQRLAVGRFWQELARAEGRRYLHAAFERVTAETPRALVGYLEIAASKIDTIFSESKSALASAERALEIFQGLGDEDGMAHARLCSGRALVFLSRIPEGEVLLHLALEHFRSAHAHKATGTTLSSLGYARALEDDMPAARSLLKEAAAAYEATGAEGRLPAVLSLLAEAEFRAGDVEAAVDVAGKGLTAARAMKSRFYIENLLCNLAAYLTFMQRYDDARVHARDALELALEEQVGVDLASVVQHLAAISALRPDEAEHARARAARLLGFVNARLASLEAPREYTEQLEYDAMVSALRAALGSDQLESLIAEGERWTEERAIAEAFERSDPSG
jgi:predicted ATPase/class 3 adenylate cyclase